MGAVTKIIYSIAINILFVLAAILNVWEFLRLLIIDLLDEIVGIFRMIVVSASAIVSLYFLFGTSEGIVTAIIVTVILLLIAALIVYFSEIICNIIGTALSFILVFLDASKIIERLVDTIMKLVNLYINDGDNIRKHDRFCVFATAYVIFAVYTVLKYSYRIMLIILFPLVALLCGGLSYHYIFIRHIPPVFPDFDWICSMLIVVVLVIIGIYAVFILNRCIKECVQFNSFGIIEVFTIYKEVFNNLSGKSESKERKNSCGDDVEHYNPYIEELSGCLTREQLKKLYRQLAKQYHPDVNSSEDACNNMALLNEAYDYWFKRINAL